MIGADVMRLLVAGLIGALAALAIAAAVLYVADLEIVEEESTSPAVSLGTGTGEPVTVPSVVGLDAADAQRKLEEVDLLTAISQEVGPGGAVGPTVVADQVPPAGTDLNAGGSVEIQLAEK
jgi:hypothetical protein